MALHRCGDPQNVEATIYNTSARHCMRTQYGDKQRPRNRPDADLPAHAPITCRESEGPEQWAIRHRAIRHHAHGQIQLLQRIDSRSLVRHPRWESVVGDAMIGCPQDWHSPISKDRHMLSQPDGRAHVDCGRSPGTEHARALPHASLGPNRVITKSQGR